MVIMTLKRRQLRLMTERHASSSGTTRTPTSKRKTPLARRLDVIRKRIEASDCPLLDWNGIDEELRRIR